MDNTALTVNHLFYRYQHQAVLNDISFHVQKGEFFIIIGPNGSGKTTLLKLINGLLPFPSNAGSGAISLFGHPLSHYPRKLRAQYISWVSQDVPSDIPFCVREVVMMGRFPYMGIWGMENQQDHEQVESAMAFTQITHLAHRKLAQLSAGERQRVFIARAICQSTPLMLLDEPTASLDLGHQIRIMDLMEQLKIEKNITIVMVSHDINLSSMYADRLLLLKNGHMISIGHPEIVLTYEHIEQAYECVAVVQQSLLGDFPMVMPVSKRLLKKA